MSVRSSWHISTTHLPAMSYDANNLEDMEVICVDDGSTDKSSLI